MKKRKRSAHLNIPIAKEQKHFVRHLQTCPLFTHLAIEIRDIFSPRIRQKRRMYLYRERKGNYAKVNV